MCTYIYIYIYTYSCIDIYYTTDNNVAALSEARPLREDRHSIVYIYIYIYIYKSHYIV